MMPPDWEEEAFERLYTSTKLLPRTILAVKMMLRQASLVVEQ